MRHNSRLSPKRKTQASAIQILKNKQEDVDSLTSQISIIDKTIEEHTSALFQAINISIRSSLSHKSSWLFNLQRKFYVSAANKSINWHKEQLIVLRRDKKLLKLKLEEANGTLWSSRIKRYLNYILMVFFLLVISGIILLGIMTTIYLLPLWISMIIIYILIHRRSYRV